MGILSISDIHDEIHTKKPSENSDKKIQLTHVSLVQHMVSGIWFQHVYARRYALYPK